MGHHAYASGTVGATGHDSEMPTARVQRGGQCAKVMASTTNAPFLSPPLLSLRPLQAAEAQRNRDSSPENEEPFGNRQSLSPALLPLELEGMSQGTKLAGGKLLDCMGFAVDTFSFPLLLPLLLLLLFFLNEVLLRTPTYQRDETQVARRERKRWS